MGKTAIYLMTQSYLTRNGDQQLCSGVQRYTRELVRVMSELDLQPVVFQKADRPFTVTHDAGVEVVGLKAGQWAHSDPWFSYRANRLIPADAPVVYCFLELANPCVRQRSIAVQHGLWWDAEFARWKLAVIRRINWRVLRTVRAVVCVDTNYINWCLTVFPDKDLIYEKCHYIPNFVNAEEFVPEGIPPGSDSWPVILFPRRCEAKRGALLFFDACLQLWSQGLRFQAVFCGFGSLQEQIRSRAQASGFSDRVNVVDVHFNEMAQLYRNAQIVVIPSREHEGTSLSCIEAMRMGKPVVATYIGGLGNLVVPGYNGELVAPRAASLAAALARLLESRELRALYGQRALAVSGALTADRWRESMRNLIRSSLLAGSIPAESTTAAKSPR